VVGPRISVVIPTRGRAESLRLCLEALSKQLDLSRDQVVVGVDGSDAPTEQVAREFESVEWLWLDHRGTCAARNKAVSASNGEVVLFIDDDIVVAPGLVERHREFHSAHQDLEDALVGLVTWDPSKPISKHMLWLEDGGPLFAFNLITDPTNVDPAHFCTANVSVKKELLSRVDGPFDERIKRFTDVELGARLAGQGMRLHYDSDAVGWHLRVDTPASTDQRMREVGRASVLLDELHPGIAPPSAPRTGLRHLKAGIARVLTPLASVLPASIADKVWSARAAWSYSEGRASAGALR